MSIKNIWNIFEFNFKMRFKFVALWCVGILSIMFMYMILFPSVSNLVGFKMDIMPKGVLKLFGMDKSMMFNDFIQYFGMVYRIVLLAMVMFVTSFTAGLIYKEENTKAIEFLNALPVNRWEIYAAKGLLGLFSTLRLVAMAIVASLAAGFINGGESFVVGDLLKTALIMSFILVFYWAVALGASGVWAKSNPTAIANVVMGISYMLGYLGVLLNKSALINLSPFEVFTAQNALKFGTDVQIGLAIYSFIGVLAVLIGGFVYNRRDFKI